MTDSADTHLNRDGLLRAAIDENDLTRAERAHLERCVDCRAKFDRFESDLAWLAHQARQSAPQPQLRIVLPPENVDRRVRPLGYGLATVAVALVAVALAWFWNGPQSQRGLAPRLPAIGVGDRVAQEVELQALTDNSLPDVYLDMIGDEETGFSDDFFEFIAPIPEQNDELLDGNYNCKEVDYA
jgi:hypothetical protein